MHGDTSCPVAPASAGLTWENVCSLFVVAVTTLRQSRVCFCTGHLIHEINMLPGAALPGSRRVSRLVSSEACAPALPQVK